MQRETREGDKEENQVARAELWAMAQERRQEKEAAEENGVAKEADEQERYRRTTD